MKVAEKNLGDICEERRWGDKINEVRLGERSSDEMSWDATWRVKSKLRNAKQFLALHCAGVARRSCSWTTNTHAWAWLAHRVWKVYRWEKPFSITLRQLRPRLVPGMLSCVIIVAVAPLGCLSGLHLKEQFCTAGGPPRLDQPIRLQQCALIHTSERFFMMENAMVKPPGIKLYFIYPRNLDPCEIFWFSLIWGLGSACQLVIGCANPFLAGICSPMWSHMGITEPPGSASTTCRSEEGKLGTQGEDHQPPDWKGPGCVRRIDRVGKPTACAEIFQGGGFAERW